ncbi:hypothetical protein [Microbacterium immunditiarum]|uniref:DUF3137 domain-containing protein n=1 Tax=Microbacterium immunditiarum TaxID=337480 RepID=A0A7Y9GLH5_9MICO|nr:hypothetical protein [Microbacterium immunditiarum]NYE18521.1 hypothetical protein [Microbacterium immunditiarum]
MSSPIPFDARPLTEPVDRAAVAQFARTLRQSGRVGSGFSGSAIVLVVVVSVFFVMFGGVVVGVFTTVFAALASAGDAGLAALLPMALPLVLIGIVAMVLVVSAVLGPRKRRERWYRLDRFAGANGMTFEPQHAAPPLPGMIFSIGTSRVATDLVRGTRPRFVEFANYQYVTGSGKNRTTHNWGYVAVKLDVPLPHIVLDATGNNSVFGSNLPAAYKATQRLSLEGDFDRHFSLYCPEGYERDALYLFTPDIMARFIDNAAALDVEIVDDWLFLYAKRPLSTLDAATWAWLFSAVGALLDKFAQWARWRDDRLRADAAAHAAARSGFAASGSDAGAHALTAAADSVPFAVPHQVLTPPPPGVAPQGRRLRQRASLAWILIVGVLVFWFVMQIAGGGLFGSLLR